MIVWLGPVLILIVTVAAVFWLVWDLHRMNR